MHILRRLVLIVVAFTAAACSDRRPANVLDEQRMGTLLKDILVLNTGIDLTTPFVDDRRKIFSGALEPVLEFHGTTREQLTDSYTWYLYHPVEFDIVMTICQDSLTALQERMDVPVPVTDTTSPSPVNALVPKLTH